MTLYKYLSEAGTKALCEREVNAMREGEASDGSARDREVARLPVDGPKRQISAQKSCNGTGCSVSNRSASQASPSPPLRLKKKWPEAFGPAPHTP